MHTHKAKVGFIGRLQKTAKAECGATVKVAAVAIDSDCTCPGCRTEIDKFWAGSEALVEHMQKQGLDATDLLASKPKRYRTIYFL